jgi:hypothetical protein
MIRQLYHVKNLSITLLYVLLVVCFCLVHGGVAIVYGAMFSVTQYSNIPGTQTQTAVPSPSSSGTQNSTSLTIYSTPVTVVSPSPTSTQTTTPSPSTSQNTPATQASFTPYNTPEHTIELVNPVNFSPLSGDEPLLPMAETYAVTVCLSYNNMTVSDCADKITPSQASEKLAAMMLNKYLNGVEVRPFRVVMPSVVPSDQQIQLLRQIETDAIAIMEAGMLKEGNQQKQNIIIASAKIARQEAQSGANWSHNLKNDRISHDFHIAKVFKQFSNIF